MTEPIEATEDGTENAAAFRFATENLRPTELPLTDTLTLVRAVEGERWETHDLGSHQPTPRRSTGTILVHDAESFVSATTHRRGEPMPVVYFDEQVNGLVAVLNDDATDAPGWRDHRVALTLRRTPEWEAWRNGQGLGEQARFAERIEDGEPEIIEPAASIMLELAQTFHATGNVKFRGGIRLASGARQFAWDETIEASGGTDPGTIAVPERFKLAVKPFVRSAAYEVEARFRFRLRSGELAVGYDLIRPEAVERDAFTQVVDAVRADLPGGVFLAGPAPAASR